jgi:hypothetical protein
MPSEFEIEEYITSWDWKLTCKVPKCKWTSHGERTENFIEEMHEDIRRHEEWHKEEKAKTVRCGFCQEWFKPNEVNETEMAPGHWVNVCEQCELVSGINEGK